MKEKKKCQQDDNSDHDRLATTIEKAEAESEAGK